MRNAGVKNFYKRGKIFYRVKNGQWESLGTTIRREALVRMRVLEERDITAKFLKKSGLNIDEIREKLSAIEEKFNAPIAAAPAQQSLAPSFANALAPAPASEREDFESAGSTFAAQIPCPSDRTSTMWKGCQKKLLELLKKTKKLDGTDISGLSLWERFEKISPSRTWNLLQNSKAGNSTLNQHRAYLRKFVPHFIGRRYLPAHLQVNVESIPHLKVHARDPHIPEPPEMDLLAAEWRAQDVNLSYLMQAMRFSGARKGAFLDKHRGLRWGQVDLANAVVQFHQKGDKKAKVPMGPQLCALLTEWKERSKPVSDEDLVFPFGSTLEDTAQDIMTNAAEKLGGNLADMHHFHALKHYYKTTHQKAGTPDRINDLLTFNSPAGRDGSGANYRHADWELMREWADKVVL